MLNVPAAMSSNAHIELNYTKQVQVDGNLLQDITYLSSAFAYYATSTATKLLLDNKFWFPSKI